MHDVVPGDVPVIPAEAALDKLRQAAASSTYFAMYSSYLDGIVTEPALMLVPVDDHLVHRGDGVFETFKCVDGALYNLQAHLERLRASADAIGLALPCPFEALTELVVATVRAGGRSTCSVRLLLSRGPGSFCVNPYKTTGPQLYIIAYAAGREAGDEAAPAVTARISSVPVKPPFFASIKSCNYLPNVLMKKEAEEAGVDLVIALDGERYVAEGPTENIAVVSPDTCLCVPRRGNILPGTTMARVLDLAASLKSDGLITSCSARNIDRNELYDAREILVLGTTPGVSALVKLDGRTIGSGQPGPVCRALRQLLIDDLRHNAARRTPVF